MSSQIILNDKTKERLDSICKKDNREVSDMIDLLIDDYCNRVLEKNETNYYNPVEFKKKEIGDYKKPPHEVYEKLLKLRGIGWEGNLEESRS
jgi:hypothetical protein